MNHTFYGAASITGSQRSQIIRKESLPGPGAYDPAKQDKDRIPEWTLKPKIQFTSCFHSNNSFVPAPGAYNIMSPISSPNDQKSNNQKNSKNMRYKERNSIEKSSPVIALQIPSFVDEHNGFSFGYRDQVIFHETSPGPIYNLNEVSDQSRKKKILNSSIGFGFGQRSRIQKGEAPGPGNYDPSPQKLYATSGKWTFSKSQRKDKPQMQNPTGPGEYNPQMVSTCRTFKLKGRHPYAKSDCIDTSPQSYNLPDTKSKRGVVFNKKSSPKLKLDSELDDSPSPFSYNISNTASRTGGFSLGRKFQTTDYNIDNPGPGSYENECQLYAKSGGYISKKQRQRKKIMEQSDNFYKYNPKLDMVTYKYPQFTFKQSKGIADNNSPQLGPGTYNLNKTGGGEGYTMGKNIRFKPLQKQKCCVSLSKQGINQNLTGYIPSYLYKKRPQKMSTLPGSNSQKQNIFINTIA